MLKDNIVKEIRDATGNIKNGDVGGGMGEFIVKYEDPQKPNKVVKGVFPPEWKRILQLAGSRVNALMVGPSGCGKTFLAKKVAETLDLRFAAQSCSEGMDEGIFLGLQLPIHDNGSFDYVPSAFMDMYENGGVFLLDEIDAADGNTLAFINSAIGNDYFYNDRRWKQTLVERHPDFVMLAAANTFGHGGDMLYNARNQLDEATLDRFKAGLVAVDYSEKVERSIVAEEVYDWGIWVRKGIEALKINRIMSTRVMSDFSKLKAHHGWARKDFEKIYYQDWARDDVKRLNEWIIKEIKSVQAKIASKL